MTIKNGPLEADIEAFRARFMAHVPEDSPDDSLVIIKGYLLSVVSPHTPRCYLEGGVYPLPHGERIRIP